MTLALTKVVALGVPVAEPVTKRWLQRLTLTITAANTDATHDYGTYAGTFWTAVGSTEPGLTALKAIKDIQVRASSFLRAGGKGISDKAMVDASRDLITKIDSAASSGGNATETLTVTGLLTTDTILGVSQFVDGAGAGVGILAYGNASGAAAAANALSVTWDADPGAGAKVRVAIKRASGTTTPEAGTYQLALNGTNTKLPDISFASGDAPTATEITLEWLLKDGEEPVECYKAA